jgi:hypothetical protein
MSDAERTGAGAGRSAAAGDPRAGPPRSGEAAGDPRAGPPRSGEAAGDPRAGPPRSGEAAGDQSWEALCDALRRAGRLVLGGAAGSERDRAEALRYLTRFLASGVAVCVEHADAEQPEFCRMIEASAKWGLDMPDCLYLFAPVREGASYRIHGSRGSANHFDVQVNAGHFASGDIASWSTLASAQGDALAAGRDGAFELRLGGERRAGNWLPVGPGAEFVLIRQYFADWERERPAELAIEREGGGPPAPAPTGAQMEARLARLAEWLTRGGALWDRMARGLLALPPNTLAFHDPGAAGARAGLAGQAYGMGHFACRPGEAVLLEFPVPRCRHWSVSLADRCFASLDYATRQSSLNGHQAAVDDDGVFRAVIARDDPGVANWLDPAGYEDGILAVRFLLAERAPTPTLSALPLAELGARLPAKTRRVTPAERLDALLARQRAVWRRFRR